MTSGPFQNIERDIRQEDGAIAGPSLAYPSQNVGSGRVDTKCRKLKQQEAGARRRSSSQRPSGARSKIANGVAQKKRSCVPQVKPSEAFSGQERALHAVCVPVHLALKDTNVWPLD